MEKCLSTLYLGSAVCASGEIEVEVSHRFLIEWGTKDYRKFCYKGEKYIFENYIKREMANTSIDFFLWSLGRKWKYLSEEVVMAKVKWGVGWRRLKI